MIRKPDRTGAIVGKISWGIARAGFAKYFRYPICISYEDRVHIPVSTQKWARSHKISIL
jgi:hypothetical protein